MGRAICIDRKGGVYCEGSPGGADVSERVIFFQGGAPSCIVHRTRPVGVGLAVMGNSERRRQVEFRI